MLKVCRTLGPKGCLNMWKIFLKKLQKGSLNSVAVYQLIYFRNVILNLVLIVLLGYLFLYHYCSAGFVLIANSDTEEGTVAEYLGSKLINQLRKIHECTYTASNLQPI